MWSDLVDSTLLYGVHSQGYCHLVVASMDILSFGTMCRYSDVNRLKWENIRFEPDLSSFEITFAIRKKFQFRQGNKVLVEATKDIICPLELLIKLEDLDVNHTPSSPFFFASIVVWLLKTHKNGSFRCNHQVRTICSIFVSLVWRSTWHFDTRV